MKKILGFIFRQYNIGQWWGGFLQIFSNIAVFLSLFNTTLLVPIAYVTWFTPWVSNLGLIVPFTVFVSVIFIIGIVLLVVGYKVLVPSSFVFANAQAWKHANPIRTKLNKMEKNQDNQNKRLKVIEKILREVEKQIYSNRRIES